MPDLAIRVENLGKQYRIGRVQPGSDTLRETLLSSLDALALLARRADRNPTIWALQEVSFEIARGEVVGIIGRNGAGKSTLLKILADITEPTTGYAEIRGRVGSLLEVGTGFQAELTGRENIYLNGAILGMRKAEIERKFDEIVSFAEVERFIDTPIKRYSTGMYMRLAFAVAAHLETEILLVDEVLAVGDVAFQKKCLGKMGDVAREGRTVLFVSHNVNAVEQLCSCGLVLDGGRVQKFSYDVRAIIKEYLFDSNSDLPPSHWTNRGNEYESARFKPLQLFVCDANGCPQPMPVPNDADTWIQVEAQIEEFDPALRVGYSLYTESGTLLYSSFHTDGAEARWPRLTKGHNVLRTRIPPRLLNEGLYKIELNAGLHARQWLLQPGLNTPTIYLSVQASLRDSPYWTEKRPGLLAPLMEWTLDPASSRSP